MLSKGDPETKEDIVEKNNILSYLLLMLLDITFKLVVIYIS